MPDTHDASLSSMADHPDEARKDSSASQGWSGILLVCMVSALAFFLASFPARNSDLWMYLASGRRLAQGAAAFGAGTGLALSRTWLFDLLSYNLFSTLGGAGLVVVKALLVVGIALLLLRLSRVGREWWVPAVCTALSVLAMSTRLFVQPATVSCLFLALTLLFVWARGDGSARKPIPLLPPWQLVALFVIWVNMDGWFLLGLGTVGLVWLGESLDEISAVDGRQSGWPIALLHRGVAFGLLAAACLLNPSHIAVFTREPLAALDSFAEGAGSGAITSPFQRSYFAYFGANPAALAYFLLLVLSLLSFGLNWRGWSWQRFLPWLGLAALSAFYARAIPFFAIVAGPALARNTQEYIACAVNSSQGLTPVWRRRISAGHAMAVVIILILPLCAWPGWLQSSPFQSRPYEPRQWAVEIPPSVEKGAATTQRWLQEGKLGSEARGLHLSPVTAHGFAWHCPEAQGLRDELMAAVVRGDAEAPPDWSARMHALGINYVILYDTEPRRLWATMDRLLQDQRQWPLLFVEGQLSVFGWRDPAALEANDPFQGRQLDISYLAFHPADDKKAPRAPRDRVPEAREWWDAFWKPVQPRPIDQDEATLHLFHAEAMRSGAPERHLVAWEASQLGGLVGAAAGWVGPSGLVDARIHLLLYRPQPPAPGGRYDTMPPPDQLVHALQQRFHLQRDDASPADLYLAVRAARRAVAINPDDAQAYLILGECYLRFLDSTRERSWGQQQLPELIQLRRAQASAALNQAVLLRPDFAQAHLSLSKYYSELGYVDLTLEHLRTYDKLIKKEGGPPSGVSDEQAREANALYEEEMRRLTKEVDKRLNMFEVAAADWKVRDRAFKAFQMGLAGKARELLLDSNIAAFGTRGTALELELLLKTGRARQVLEWVGSEHESMFGAQPYHWLRAVAMASLGDYALAQEECNQLCGSLASGAREREPVRFREIMAILVARQALAEPLANASLANRILSTSDKYEFPMQLDGLAQNLRREADMTVLRGLLALEEGDVAEAEIAFRGALACWKDAAAVKSGGGFDFKSRLVAQECLEWLK